MFLSRNEARALRSTLEPGTQRYSDLERALIFGQGLVTLNDGTKINTTPDCERLLGGVPPQEVPIREFDVILEKVIVLSSLSISDPEQAVAICGDVYKGIHILIEYTEATLRELEMQEKGTNQELLNSVKNHAIVSGQFREGEIHLEDLRAQLTGLSKNQEELNQAIMTANAEQKKIKKKLKKERRKEKWIFLRNDKKHYKKQKKRKKKELEYLEDRKKTLSIEINNQNALIVQMSTEITRISSQITTLSNTIQQLGRQLTTLREIGLELKKLGNEYHLLTWDINVIKKFFVAGLEVGFISSFLDRIKTIQVSFLKWSGGTPLSIADQM